MKKKKIKIKNSKILIMGLTFKENCADIRNSGVKKCILMN
jgi:UDP-N-acetyl-D-galactosamine dehydrogenase